MFRGGVCVRVCVLPVCLFSCHGSSGVVVETGVAVASAAGVGETRDENGEDAGSAVVWLGRTSVCRRGQENGRLAGTAVVRHCW